MSVFGAAQACFHIRSKTYRFGHTPVEGRSDGTRGKPQNGPCAAPEGQQKTSETRIQSKAVPTFHTSRIGQHAHFQSSSPCSIIHGITHMTHFTSQHICKGCHNGIAKSCSPLSSRSGSGWCSTGTRASKSHSDCRSTPKPAATVYNIQLTQGCTILYIGKFMLFLNIASKREKSSFVMRGYTNTCTCTGPAFHRLQCGKAV